MHAFRELVQSDKRYQLFIAGKIEYPYLQLYFKQMIKEMRLEDNIHFEGWIESQNINTWLDNKHYILCTSIHEGHPVGIMEAMACGLKPLIHNYVGARESYPGKYIWSTIPEFVKMTTEDSYDPAEYRNFIESNYSLRKQLESVDKIIQSTCISNTLISVSDDTTLETSEVCS